jgi:hypothetical protein
MDRSTVYVGYTRDFIDGVHERIICASGHDMLFLDADDVNQVHNRILDGFEHYNNWSDMLNEKLKTVYSLQDMLNDSKAIFDSAIALADTSFYNYANIRFEERVNTDPEAVSVLRDKTITLDTIMTLNQDKRIRVYNPQTYIIDIPESGICCAVRNLFFRVQHRGWLVTVPEKREIPQSRGALDLQDELGDIIERWMEHHQTQNELSERASVFLQILEDGNMSDDEAYRRIESLNWTRNDEMQIYVFQQEADRMFLFDALERKLEQLGNAYTVNYEGNLALTLNRSMTEISLFENELGKVLENVKHVCGRSPAFADILQLKPNYELAKVANIYGKADNNRIKDIESALLPYGFTLIVKNASIGLMHPALKRIKEYDEAHSTQLYETLDVYLQFERNYVKSAKALFIHRNTLLYRIERISELTGVDLESPEVRLYLLMSFKIEQYMKAVPGRNREAAPAQ